MIMPACSRSALDQCVVGWRSLFLVLFSLASGPSSAHAQALPRQHWDLSERFKTFIHESWTSEHGLPQNVISAIAQTPDDYLWLGTQSGLVRFNSVTFTNFDRYNTPAIANEFIRRLAVSQDSTLWVGTEHGGVVSLRNGKFAAHGLSDSLAVEGTRVVVAGKKNVVWVSIPGLGIWKKDNDSWNLVRSNKPLLSVWTIYEDTDGSLWLGENGGLVHLIGDSAVWYGASHGMPKTQVISVLRDSRGTLIIGTRDRGLFFLSNKKVSPLPGAEALNRSNVVDLSNDPGKGVWIGCLDKGLYYYDGSSVEPCIVNPAAPPLRVTAIASDREGNLWFGTMGDGIHRLRRSVVQNLKVTEPGIFDEVWAVLSQGEKLWVGTRSHGIRLVVGGKSVRPPMSAKLSASTVSALLQGPQDSLWIGTENGLFVMSEGRDEEVLMPDGSSFTNVYALLRDRTGRVWIGAQGLYVKDGKRVDRVPHTPPGFTVNVLLEDRMGNIWIGSDAHGVGYLDGKKLSFFNSDSGLTSNTILSLYEDQTGAILAGTQAGGLNRYHDGRWGAVTSENGLPDNVVNSLIRADDGTVWMSTNKGLFGVSEASIAAVTDKKVSHIEGVSIDSRDFLQSTEFGGGLQSCAAISPDGTLWFVSLKGLVGYNPRTSKRKLPPPSILVEMVSVNGQFLPVQDGMELGPGVRSIQFEYVALSYVLPAATRYAFYLEGFSDDWIDGRNQREATFTNLAPGSYTFRVRAANSDGVWSTDEASLRFVILPYFYQTGYFKVLMVVLFVLLVFGAYRIRIRQMVRREEELKRNVDEALAKIKVLHGLIPICASCKKIRDDKGYWNHLELYLREHSEAVLSHGICPDCAEKLYPEEMKRIREKSGGGAR